MPRQPRYFLPGYPQHIVIRGVDRQATFFRYADYRLFKNTLKYESYKTGCAIHAYVLMTNHVHLLATPASEESIPKMIQGLGRGYVQRINKQYNRTGTLWQGRYKACLVQDDLYLLTCQRYIELNPVRAGMVCGPARYPHSSYRHNALDGSDSLVTPHPVYQDLGNSEADRRLIYRRMFESVLDQDLLDVVRDSTNACRVLGDDAFVDQIEAVLDRRVRPGKPGRPKKRSIA